MPLPASVTPITVTGSFYETEPGEGQPIEGVTVTFIPDDPGPHRVPADDEMLLIKTESATSGVDGDVTFTMAGSFDPAIDPGTKYTVTLSGALTKTYQDVVIPHDAPGGTIDLTDILPGGEDDVGHAYKLVALEDVDLSTPPTDGQVLAYQASSQKWKPANGGTGGGAGDLDDLSDVDVSTTPPAANQVLKYDGSLWEPGAVGWTEVTSKPTAFPAEAHSHDAPTWASITDKPTTFAPALPIPMSGVTDLETNLAGKAATGHTHTIANVDGLQAALDGKQVLTNAVSVARQADGNWPARPTVTHVTWIERNFNDPLVPPGMLEGDMYEGPDGLAGEVP